MAGSFLRKLRVLVGLALVAGAIAYVGYAGVEKAATPGFEGHVAFSRGDRIALGSEGAGAVEAAAQFALNHPGLAIHLIGHTGTDGDAAANLTLSERRAEAVRTALVTAHGIDGARISLEAAGGGDPLSQREGESARAYQNRLARVEVIVRERAP